jgi:hypothetical protein
MSSKPCGFVVYAVLRLAPGNRGLSMIGQIAGKDNHQGISGTVFTQICSLTFIHGNIGIGIFSHHET